MLDFARENLFGPLGIEVERSVIFHRKEEQMAFYRATDMSVWAAGPTGVNAGGWTLRSSAAMSDTGRMTDTAAQRNSGEKRAAHGRPLRL